MSVPNPATTDWVQLGTTPGPQGPQGAQGAQGAQGPQGTPGVGVIRSAVECSVNSATINYATWTWVGMTLQRQDGGWYLWDVNNLIVPVAGYHVIDCLVHSSTTYAGSAQFQVRVLKGGSTEIARGQMQTGVGGLDDFPRCSAVRWLNAGDSLNIQLYEDNSGAPETLDTVGYLTAARLC